MVQYTHSFCQSSDHKSSGIVDGEVMSPRLFVLIDRTSSMHICPASNESNCLNPNFHNPREIFLLHHEIAQHGDINR